MGKQREEYLVLSIGDRGEQMRHAEADPPHLSIFPSSTSDPKCNTIFYDNPATGQQQSQAVVSIYSSTYLEGSFPVSDLGTDDAPSGAGRIDRGMFEHRRLQIFIFVPAPDSSDRVRFRCRARGAFASRIARIIVHVRTTLAACRDARRVN